MSSEPQPPGRGRAHLRLIQGAASGGGIGPPPPTRAEALVECAGLPLQRVAHIEAWDNIPGNNSPPGDEDGDLLMGGMASVFRHDYPVRVDFSTDVDRSVVVRLLRKVLAWVEDGSYAVPNDASEAIASAEVNYGDATFSRMPDYVLEMREATKVAKQRHLQQRQHVRTMLKRRAARGDAAPI